jgi:hypothetical protein
MKDRRNYYETQMRAVLAPKSIRWANDTRHMQLAHQTVDFARGMSVEFQLAKDAIDGDGDLSPAGRARKTANLGYEFVTKLQKSDLPKRTSEAVAAQEARWSEMRGAVLKKPVDVFDTGLAAEV